MKVRLVEMCQQGVENPRSMLRDRFTLRWRGTLAIADTSDQGLHRQVGIARHTSSFGQLVKELFDPYIVEANDEKFVLTGFERRREGEHLVDHAEPGLCIVGWGE